MARQSLKEGPFMPRARVLGMATAGVSPRVMGIGPAPAVRQVLAMTGLSLADMSVIELNEAVAAQGALAWAGDCGGVGEGVIVRQGRHRLWPRRCCPCEHPVRRTAC